MEIAIQQLQKTIEKARKYNEREDGKLADILRSHVQDILEDIVILEKYRTGFKDRETEVLQLIAQGREIKREMEKEAFSLEALAKRKEPAASATVSTNKVSSSIKLPRIELPCFDGETGEDFRGFMDAFLDAISAEPNLSEVKKWLLLKARIKGQAFDLIKDLPIAPESYKVAVDQLTDTYGSVKRAILRLYQRIQSLADAEMETESLRSTYTQMEGILRSLKHLGVDPNTDDFLRAVVIGKYPNELLHLLRVTDAVSLDQFRKEVGDHVKLRDCTIRIAKPPLRETNTNNGGTKGGAGGNQNKKPRHLQSDQNSAGGSGTPLPPSQVNNSNNSRNKKSQPRTRSCVFCTGEHFADECDKFKTLEERTNLVTDRCQRCLRPRHEAEETCKSKRVCFYCKDAKHNSALCPKQFAKVLLNQDIDEGRQPSRFVTAMLPVGNVSRTKGANARAILDTAGGRSLITEELARELELGANGKRKIRFVGVNRTPLGDAPSVARRLLLFPPGERPIEIDVFVVPEIVDNVASTSVAEIRKQHPKYSSLPMPDEGNGQKIQLLLGYRSLTTVVTLQKSIRVSETLQLLSTKFGWIPFGGLPGEDEEKLDSSVIGLVKEQDPVKLMSDLELVGLSDFLKNENEEEALVLDKYYKTIRRYGECYEVEWPYKTEEPELDDNFGLAYGRLVSLLRQLKKNPTLLEAYDRLIKDQLEDGIVEVVNMRAEPRKNLVHYLPHRAVIRLNKSTPIRMVFDAAARCGKLAKSLNDLIMKGGNWVNDIPGVLMRFRRYGVAVTTDIVKAFHQISIAPKDRDVVRFIWLRDPTKQPTKDNLCVYRFRRMAFGVVASPFLLTATIKHHLRSFPNEFGEIIERDLYADNLITSLPRSTNAEHFYRSVKECFSGMSMTLSQWATDDAHLRSKFADSEAATGARQSVLGVEWRIANGKMRIRSPGLDERDGPPPTKRIALKEMASVYDPLGWMSPVVLSARLVLRRIWDEKYDWDKLLAPDLADKWREMRQELNAVAEVDFPRTYGFGGVETAQRAELHAFCDASGKAYGVVIYLCIYGPEGCWSGIVAAKTRLAPNTKISIPRMELLAAVTACRFMVYVERSLHLEIETTKYLWGDAKCVIAWSTSNKILPVFVEKSVKTIKAAGAERFLYVPTLENPADVVSRGASVQELQNTQWWRGPRWLTDSSKWPAQDDACETKTELDLVEEEMVDEEAKLLFLQAAIRVKKQINPAKNENSPFGLNPGDFSSIGDLMWRTAFCLRAAGRFLRGRGTIPAKGRLDYQEARRRWFRWDQQRVYEEATDGATNVSYLKNLRASLDTDGLIRCETRLKYASITRETAEPILLVKKSALTKLLILTLHEINKHSGTAHTLAALRKRYWLPQGRREVYQILKTHCNAWPRPDRTKHRRWLRFPNSE